MAVALGVGMDAEDIRAPAGIRGGAATSAALPSTSRVKEGSTVRHAGRTYRKAVEILSVSAGLYRELALSALELLPHRRRA